MKKITVLTFALVMMLGLVLAGCGNKNNAGDANDTNTNASATATDTNKQADDAKKADDVSGSIVALGSTALQPLVDEAQKQYATQNPNAQIQVQGGGSGTGLSQVAAGGADIGNSDIFAEEKSGIDASALVDHKVAVVGMAPVANPGVGVDGLTQQQLIDIFTGKIKNWSEVGGADQAIVIVNRPKSSGTRATFFTFALNKNEEVASNITEDSSGTVRKIIGETKGAIGYEAFSYFDNTIKPLAIDGVQPTAENVETNKWKVWAYEHMYTKGEATGLTKAFLDYMVSPDVQNSLVTKLGYIPVTNMKVERDAAGNVTQK